MTIESAAASPSSASASPTGAARELTLVVYPHLVARRLATVIVALLILSSMVEGIRLATGHDRIFGLLRVLSVEGEASLPALFSALQLLLAATVLGAIWLSKREVADRFTRHWGWLAAIFCYMVADEAIGLHELATNPLQRLRDFSGPLTFTWVLVVGPLVLFFALAYVRFLLHLPPRTRTLVAVAGSTFVLGALGFEFLEGMHYAAVSGDTGFQYLLLNVAEEALEMGSITLFVYALLDYVVRQRLELRLMVAERPSR
jgi:hypothetical protein